MERKQIICPETSHVEVIELEPTPFGIVIASCSRFSPPTCVECTCECAARLDRRDRGDMDSPIALTIPLPES
jgi:hypothetical protein